MPLLGQTRWIFCLASWSLTGGLSTGAWAQATALTTTAIEVTAPVQPYRQFDKVEITGSSIIRKEQTQALPVMVFTREDIRRTGLQSLAEVLQALPSMSNFVEPSQLALIAGGYSNAAIHGLPTGTLVLVNGLRMAPFGRPTMVGEERSGVDLQTLPLANVERIEVLTDGASSLYGTDAVAGVVNVILRSQRQGTEVHAHLSRPDGARGQGWSSSLSWGHGQLQRDGHSFLFSLEAAGRRELLGADRPYASQGQYIVEQQGQRYTVDAPRLSFYGSPATLEQRNAAGQPVRWFNTAAKGGACAGSGVSVSGQPACLSNLYPSLGIYPDESQQRLHARAEFLTAEGLTLFGELLLGRSLSSIAYRPWPGVASAYGLAPGSAAYVQALQAGLDPANTRLLWQPDLPALRLASEQTNGRISLGLKGEGGGWDHSSQLYMAQSQAQNLYAQTISTASLGLTPEGVWDSPWVLRPLDANNPLTQAVAALRSLPPDSAGTNTVYGLQLSGSRPLAEWPSGDVLLGLGLDWREEQTDYQNQRSPAVMGQPSFSARRQVVAGFAELQLPLTPSWEAQLGVRADHYQDVGSTFNAKLATRWALNAQWSLRAAVGSGFRAPSVAQTHRVDNPFVWGEFGTPLDCTAAQQAVAQSLSTANGESGICDPRFPVFVLGNGNPDLKPETSTQLSWGLAFVPHRNLRLAADFWAVRIQDTLQMATPEAVLNAPAQHANNYALLPAPFVQAAGLNPRSMVLYMPLQNMGVKEKVGLDLEAQWRRPGDWGLWLLQAQATRMLRSRVQPSPGSAYSSDLAQFDPNTWTIVPRWRGRIIGGLTRPEGGLHAVLNYIGGHQGAAKDATNLASGATETVRLHVPAFTTWDLVFQTALRTHLDLRIGMRNVFNRQAPLSLNPNTQQLSGANTDTSNLWGRVVELGLTARF